MTPSEPFHPAYGLADETRKKILEDAESLGVADAAELHGVARQSVYMWRKRIATSPAHNPRR